MVAANDPLGSELGSGRSDRDFTSFCLKYLNKAINIEVNVAVNTVSVLNKMAHF